ncbi:MAG: beta-propeller domain-containing protein, partial [Myxococcales bacterium]|nr:beta-propeller domain-containing protein [Myxococcales bacterium]
MSRSRRVTVLVAAVLALPIFIACGDGASNDTAPAVSTPREAPPVRDPSSVEESDLYKLVGSRLYVHNPHTGLNVIDVSNPSAPKLLGRADAEGRAGELYVRDGRALVLLEQATSTCSNFVASSSANSPAVLYNWTTARSELSIIDARATPPAVRRRVCLPGSPVSSRLVGRTLYIVTTTADQSNPYGYNNLAADSHVLVLDVSNLDDVRLIDHRTLPNAGREIHVTDRALFVASRSRNNDTVIDYYAIDGERGALAHVGQREVTGEPQGRFHIDATDTHLRIVTFDTYNSGSVLTVLRYGEGGLQQIGQLDGIAYGERLFATRFDGDRAYVVTFRQTDPLWVIDLSKPQAPRIVGELQVPGWSDFIYPRGDRLLAVGRGNNGRGFGVSLFDISDLEHPRVLSQLTFGDQLSSNTGSAANSDHRAVTVLEREGELPLLLVPYSNYFQGYYGDGESVGSGVGRLRQGLSVAPPSCIGEHYLKLVDVGSWSLTGRGQIDQRGAIERTLLVGNALLSLSHRELASLDISDRDNIKRNARLDLTDGKVSGNIEDQQACWGGSGWFGGMVDGEDFDGGWVPFRCSLPAGSGLGA